MLIIFIWAGLLWSRALLSLAVIAFLITAILTEGRAAWKRVRDSWWLSGMTFLFLVPLVSGLWSEDKDMWLAMVQEKLPLLFFPFTASAVAILTTSTRRQLLVVLCFFLLSSVMYSITMYLAIPNGQDAYLKAKVMRVVMSDDHVRYALLLLFSMIWVGHEASQHDVPEWFRYGALLYLLVIAFFLHVLAAKTGLLGLYLLVLLWTICHFQKIYRMLVLMFVALVPLLAWFLLPSFQNRLRFVWWDFQQYSRGGYVEGLSDTPRVFSFQAGFGIFRDHFWTGVGLGDLRSAVNNWYQTQAPFLKEYERLLPSNEVLFYGASVGIVGAITALLVLVLPLFSRPRRSLLQWSFHLLILMISFYEIGWETQYGVTLYGFFGVFFFTLRRQEEGKSSLSF